MTEPGPASARWWLRPSTWFAASVAVALLYGVILVVAPGRVGLAVAQVIFLTPPAVAALLGLKAARLAPPRSRAAKAWALLGAATSLLFLTEFIYAYRAEAGLPLVEAVGILDLFSALATLCFLALVFVSSEMDADGGPRAVRRILDILAFGTLAFVIVFRFWVVDLIGTVDRASLVEAVRLAVYSSIGVLVFVGNLFVVRSRRLVAPYPWTMLNGTAIAVFSLGVILWPVWSLSASAGNEIMGILVDLFYLVGYVLFAAAAAIRLALPDEPWSFGPEPPMRGETWPSIAGAVGSLASVGLLAAAAGSAANGSAEQFVYLVALGVSTVCTAGRTALSARESGSLLETSVTDDLTGALNRRPLDESLGARVAWTSRFGDPFALAVVDVDDFSTIRREHGNAVADTLLAEVADELVSVAGRDSVFRLSGDVFAVLASVGEPEDSRTLGTRLLAAVRRKSATGLSISLSVGIAECPRDAVDPDELMRKAEAARVWAKYHGRHRAVRYDQEILNVMGVNERVGHMDTAAGGVGVARALASATDAHDSGNYRHSRNVAVLAVLLARAAGLAPDEIARIEIAALLHDVGKILLPEEVTRGASTSVRMRLAARMHAEHGGDLVVGVGLPEVPSWVRSHHERWDGQGYPDGLVGEDIPLGARIIALADAYDGMTSGAAGGCVMSKGAALQEIDLGMGTKFDPALAELFIAVVGATEALGWGDEWTAA